MRVRLAIGWECRRSHFFIWFLNHILLQLGYFLFSPSKLRRCRRTFICAIILKLPFDLTFLMYNITNLRFMFWHCYRYDISRMFALVLELSGSVTFISFFIIPVFLGIIYIKYLAVGIILAKRQLMSTCDVSIQYFLQIFIILEYVQNWVIWVFVFFYYTGYFLVLIKI